MKFLSYDSPLGRIGTAIFDLIWLQILVVLTSIPLITIGASFTAMHSVLLKMYRDELSSLSREYFRAFISNFKQATLIWLLYVVCIAIMLVDYIVSAQLPDTGLRIVLQLLPIPLVLLCVTLTWVFVLLSRYQNTIRQTLKNSLLVCISRPFTTIGMILISIVPIVLLIFFPSTTMLMVFMGITTAGYMCSILYSRIFDQLEGTDWRKEAAKALAESMQE